MSRWALYAALKGAAMLGGTAVLGGMSGCAPNDPNKAPPAKARLEGSATQLFDLGYDQVRVTVSVDDVALLFVRRRPLNATLPDGGTPDEENMGTSEDYPLKVAYQLWGDEAPVARRVDLAERDMNMAARAVVSRDVLNDPRKTYPGVQRGTLYLTGALEPGAKLRGDINITFENGIETASGRTVFGSFDAQVTE
ncbi:MAG: hypothetical protein JNG84_02140 [Archangium sp.]|nr:hypothetical protein [Archangium sp.]